MVKISFFSKINLVAARKRTFKIFCQLNIQIEYIKVDMMFLKNTIKWC